MTDVSFRDIACSYIEKGYSVIAVKDKRPAIGEQWQNLRLNEVLADKFKNNWANCNGLGLILGEVSGLICLDIDILPSDEKLIDVLKELNLMLPEYFCAKIGNPEKPPARFFKYNGEKAEKFNALKIEILSNRNQTVLPPSINPVSKTNYKWVDKSIIDFDLEDFPKLPEEVLVFLRKKNTELKKSKIPNKIEKQSDSKKEKQPFNSIKINSIRSNEGSSDGLTLVDGRCKSGSHNRLSEVGVGMFFAGFQKFDIMDRLKELDHFINKDADFLYFVCPSRNHSSSNYNDNLSAFVEEIFYRHKNDKRESRHADEYYEKEKREGFTINDPNDSKQYVRKYFSLYSYLSHYNDLTYIPDMKAFMSWNGHYYERKFEEEIKNISQKFFKYPSVIKPNERTTFLELCKSSKTARIKDYLVSGYKSVNLLNGQYSIDTKELTPHDKNTRFSFVIKENFNEDSSAPVWTKLLRLICKDRVHMVQAIEEFVGYCLFAMSYDKFNKLMILDGGGSNGKSTLIRTIKGIVGDENYSAVSLESISKDRFSGSALLNKLINFCSEEPKEAFSATGILKKLTGGDPMMIEEKHKGAFPFINYAKFIVSYNKAPFFPDDSVGMRRRILLIPCEQDFEKNPELKLDSPEFHIISKERAQVIYRCIKAFESVYRRGEFTYVPEGEKKLNDMIEASDSVRRYAAECLRVSETASDYVTVDNCYINYLNFCHNEGARSVSRSELSRRLNGIFGEKLTGERVNKKRVFYGILMEICSPTHAVKIKRLQEVSTD